MIKVINKTEIEYSKDALPYIKLVDLPANTMTIVEIQHVNGKVTHYFVEADSNVSPLTLFDADEPSVCLIFVIDSKSFVRTNSVKITDWNKFMNKTRLTPEMKIAQLEARIRDLETKSPSARPENLMVPVGAVLTMCEGGKQHFKLPFQFAVQIINGKKPNKDGVIEIKMTDLPDLIQFAQGTLDSISTLNNRISEIEIQIQNLDNTVL